MSTTNEKDWIKIDLHIHTLDDPKSDVAVSAHQVLHRARSHGIGVCHFHIGLFNPNRRARRVATRFGKPLIATSDAHRLHAFGRHYTSMPMPPALTVENVFAGLRNGPLRLTSPASSLRDFVSAIYFVFLAHPFRVRRKLAGA